MFDFNIILQVINTLIIFIGLLFTLKELSLLSKQIRLATKQLDSELNWQMNQATFTYLSEYTDEHKDTTLSLQKKIGLLLEDGRVKKNKKIKSIEYDDDLRAQLYELVSYFEHLAIGIEKKYFDEEIAYRALSNVVISTYKLIKPYIKLRRKETGKRIATHFELLAKRWKMGQIK